MKTIWFVMIFISGIIPVQLYSQPGCYNIIDFGALPDGKTINSTAIQNAIDKCSEDGGGTVYVSKGVFLTGTIVLKSNVNLFLENGSILRGSPDLEDYKTFKRNGYDTCHFGIIFAYMADNVSITGNGTIDGNEEVFFDWNLPKKIEWGRLQYTRQQDRFRKVTEGIGDGPVTPLPRPRQMVIFSACRNVLVENVLLAKSPFWTLHFADCDGVTVKGVKIWNSLETPNSDGMDITSCTNVNVSDCDIRGGDDAIAITGYGYHYELPGFINRRHPSGNINITNCNLQSRSSGIRIGSEDQNTIRNINISNINITNSNRGIGIFLRDSGSVENVNISQINIETRLHTGDWWGNGEPIHISAIRSKPDITIGQIRNVTICYVTCKSENGILIYGTDESIIEDVRMENIDLVLADNKLNDLAGGNIDLRGCLSMEQSIFSHDIPGLYARYVKDLSVNDFSLKWEGVSAPYFTNGIEVEHYSGLEINNFTGTGAPGNRSAVPVSLKNGNGFRTDLGDESVKMK
jgi:polygalacturonase